MIALLMIVIFSVVGGMPLSWAQPMEFDNSRASGSVGYGDGAPMRKSFRWLEEENKYGSQRQRGSAGKSMDGEGQEGLYSTGRGIAYQVHIVGEVVSPGTYSLRASRRLAEALQKAGGIAQQGSSRHVQVRRMGSGTRTYDLLQFELYGALAQNPYLMDNDVVYVPLRKSVIQIVGSVHRPSSYELRGERTLADVIRLAGGLTVGADPESLLRIIRFDNGDKKILEVPLTVADVRSTPVYNADVIYVPNKLSAKNTFDYNIVHLPGDQVFYPSYEDRVFVLGGVAKPGPYPFVPYYGVNHYLTVAGGVSKLAYARRVKVASSDGRIRRVRRDDQSITINPGDTIYVKESRIPPEGWLQLFLSLINVSATTTAVIMSISP